MQNNRNITLIKQFEQYLENDNLDDIKAGLPKLLNTFTKVLNRMDRIIAQSDNQQFQVVKLTDTLKATNDKIQDLLNNNGFIRLMEEHSTRLIDFLLENEIEFGILCNLADVEFVKKLPDEIFSTFKPLTLFMIAGYTFQSAFINDDEELEFEAGFGRDNFGTTVLVPVGSILQILVNETVIYVNLTATIKRKGDNARNKGSIERSLNAIFSNPQNQKLIKKKKISFDSD